MKLYVVLLLAATVAHSQDPYRGYVDVISCEAIGGWARAITSEVPTVISIWDGNQLMGEREANLYRPDVGIHAFHVVPNVKFLGDGKIHFISVTFGNLPKTLVGSGKPLVCKGGN